MTGANSVERTPATGRPRDARAPDARGRRLTPGAAPGRRTGTADPAGTATSTDEPVGHLWLPSGKDLVQVPTASILRIEAERDYVRVHTADRSFLLRATLTGMAQRLDPSRFLRVHRSTVMSVPEIVGLRHQGAGAWAVIRGSGGVSPIGRSYLDEVRRSLGVRAPWARR